MLPALPKHDGYQYIWLLGCEIFHRTASSPTHVEWGSELSKAEGTGNPSPSASSPTHFDWSLVIRNMESYNGFVRMACFPIYLGEYFAQPPTFFHQFSFYRRRVVLVIWSKRQMEASMLRCHIVHRFKMETGSLGLFVCSYPNFTCCHQIVWIALFRASSSSMNFGLSQMDIHNIPFSIGDIRIWWWQIRGISSKHLIVFAAAIHKATSWTLGTLIWLLPLHRSFV